MASDAVEPFAIHAHTLTAFLARKGGQPTWARIDVIEVDLSKNPASYPDRPRVPAAAFEACWSRMVRTVDRGWINVSACGVDGDALIVAVEWFSCPGSRRADNPPGTPWVSVNLSGAADAYRWGWG